MANNIVIADQVEQALGAPSLRAGQPRPPSRADPRNVDGRLAEVAGLRVLACGAGLAAFGRPTSGAKTRSLHPSPVCDVILAHRPPENTLLDVLRRNGQHVGSLALLIARASTGGSTCHIHEASRSSTSACV